MILCPHKVAAVHMAGGHAPATGRGQAMLAVHGELTGSRDSCVHFVRDALDVASIMRPHVEWEYSLSPGVVLKQSMGRAADRLRRLRRIGSPTAIIRP